MDGTTVKIIEAQKAKLHTTYKNTKLKLLKVNAAIWYNNMCRTSIHTQNRTDAATRPNV